MKYFLIFILFVLSIVYAGYWLYMYDKRDGLNEIVSSHSTSLDNIPEHNIPEHLTTEFWKNVTFEKLKNTLKNIKNINEIRPDTQETMLVLLVRDGPYPEMLDMLINSGADYTLKTKRDDHEYKASPLHWAVIRQDNPYGFTKALLKYDQNIDEPDEVSESNPLQWALYFRSPIEVIELLLSTGSNPNFQNKHKSNPIFSASEPNALGVSFINPNVIQLLLDYKADVMMKNDKGETAYDYMKENKEFTKTEVFQQISEQYVPHIQIVPEKIQ